MNGIHSDPALSGDQTSQAEPCATVFVTHSPEETIALGRQLARWLPAGCLVSLEGELGSGKTTLTKGIVAGFGAAREEEVTSPTFTLVHEYGTKPKIYHADLYRVESSRELSTLGLEEAIEQGGVLIVEWGEKLHDQISGEKIKIAVEWVDENSRRIAVTNLNHPG